MNKNCIILEIFIIGEIPRVYPIFSDYDGPCELYTEDEAAAEVDRLIKRSPDARYQVVTLAP